MSIDHSRTHNLIYSTLRSMKEHAPQIITVLETNARAQNIPLVDYIFGLCATDAGTVQELYRMKIAKIDAAITEAKEKARKNIGVRFMEENNTKTLDDETVAACTEYVNKAMENGEWIGYFDPTLLVF